MNQIEANKVFYVAKFTRPNNTFYHDVVNSKELNLFGKQKFELITLAFNTFNEALNYLTTNKL